MRYKDIAVIGMSGRFADVNSIAEYRELLKNKKSAIDKPCRERLDLMQLPEDAEYMRCGYIKDIESFDNDFFDVTKREAKLMSPEQRISLELVADTILDAGYSLEDFRGSHCGVYVADGESAYNDFVERQSSASIIGSQSFMLSGRIGYHFDLQGENLSINSGCSSALAAVHEACEKLTIGEVDTALVGGLILYIDVPKAKENMYDILGIMSKDYTIHSFGQEANGTVCGEGGGFVLLKPLDRAIADGDHIYGVVMSGAINGDGGRCTNVSMPSVEAQRDVVKKAWDDVDIDKLTEIEAHGIGAPVGDAVEAQAYIDAVHAKKMKKENIRVSTVKPNIGHLFSLSGMSSLLKVLTGYKYRESYPIAGLETVNPLIQFEDAGMVPARNVHYWNADEERMTGISCFGLSGCNTHVVVRNYLAGSHKKKTPSVLKISAKSPEAFEDMKRNIVKAVSECKEEELADFIYTLNIGRDDYAYRGMVRVKNRLQLQNDIEQLRPTETAENKPYVIFAIKTENKACTGGSDKDFSAALPNMHAYVCDTIGFADIKDKMAVYKALLAAGIKNNMILVDKIFGTAVKYLNGECQREKFIETVEETEIKQGYAGFYQQIEKKSANREVILVDFTKEKGMQRLPAADNIHTFYVSEPEEIEKLLVYAYTSGMAIDWKALYQGTNYQRVSAPTYPFQKKRFWIEPKKSGEREETKTDTIPNNAFASAVNQFAQAVGQFVGVGQFGQPNVPYLAQEPMTVTKEKVVTLDGVKAKNLFVFKSEQMTDVDIKKYPYNQEEFKKVFVPETADIDVDFKLAMYKWMKQKNIAADVILADKRGKAVVYYGDGKFSKQHFKEAINEPVDENYDKAFAAIERLAEDGPVNVFDFGHSTEFSDHEWKGVVRVISLFREGELDQFLADPRPRSVVQYQETVMAPAQPTMGQTFSEQTAFAAPVVKPAAEHVSAKDAEPTVGTKTADEQMSAKSAEVVEAENFLETVWKNAFNLDGEIGHDEDFFALGGNSLIMQAISGQINDHFNKKFDIFEIYDYETIEKLAVKILED